MSLFSSNDYLPHRGSAVIGGVVTGATAGSVLFAGTAGALAQDNTNLFWDDTNKRLGIGTNTPAVDLSVKPDTDGGAIIGRCRLSIGGTTDRAAFSHIDMTTGLNFAVMQLATGQTLVNCATGTSCSLRHNAQERVVGDSTSTVIYGSGPVERFKADATGIGFFATAPTARSTGWTTFTNLVADKTCDADTVVVAELADIVGTLIEELKAKGLIAA